MKLVKNPIFLTEIRLVRRAGILAALIVATLVSVCLIVGLINYKINPNTFNFNSVEYAGVFFYSWIVLVESLVFYLMGYAKIAKTLVEERKSGLFDLNRLAPLSPSDIAFGYLLGPPLQEFFMGAILILAGLVIIGIAGLSFKLWFVTQILLLSTALFFGLFALVVGLVMRESRHVILFPALFFFFSLFSFAFHNKSIVSFLLPLNPIFEVAIEVSNRKFIDPAFASPPFIFGQPINGVFLALCLQILLGVVFWRLAVGKIKNPEKPLIPLIDGIFMFALILLTQTALMWEPELLENSARVVSGSYNGILFSFYVASILFGCLIINFMINKPENVLRLYLREDGSKQKLIFTKSAVPISIIMSVVLGFAIMPHISLRGGGMSRVFLLFLNSLVCLLFYAELVEYTQIKYERRALRYVALALFVVYVMPVLLALVLSNGEIVKLSFIIPGIIAIFEHPFRPQSAPEIISAYTYSIVHMFIVGILSVLWYRAWQKALTSRK